MSDHPEENLEGQPLSAAGEGHTGGSRLDEQDDCVADPKSPASKPQGTLRDQQKNMESEGQPVQLPADAGDLPATPDDEAERQREAALARDGSGF
jgi:hypothetical protein